MAQGRYGEAEEVFDRAVMLWEAEWGDSNPMAVTMLTHLAELYRRQGRLADSEAVTQRAKAMLERSCSPDHPWMAPVLGNLAEIYRRQGELSQAAAAEAVLGHYGRDVRSRSSRFGTQS